MHEGAEWVRDEDNVGFADMWIGIYAIVEQ